MQNFFSKLRKKHFDTVIAAYFAYMAVSASLDTSEFYYVSLAFFFFYSVVSILCWRGIYWSKYFLYANFVIVIAIAVLFRNILSVYVLALLLAPALLAAVYAHLRYKTHIPVASIKKELVYCFGALSLIVLTSAVMDWKRGPVIKTLGGPVAIKKQNQTDPPSHLGKR